MTDTSFKALIGYTLFSISLLCSSCSSYNLTEEEQSILGAWEFEIAQSEDGSRNYSFLRLDKDRQGFKGLLHEKGSDLIFAPMLSHDINHWMIKKDTLIVTYTFEEGVISVPRKEDQEYDAFQEKDYLIIKEMGVDYFIAESYDPSIPWTSEQRYEKRDGARNVD